MCMTCKGTGDAYAGPDLPLTDCSDCDSTGAREAGQRPVGRCIGCFHDFTVGPCGGCGAVPHPEDALRIPYPSR
jgi:hypothetical protein